MWQDIEINQALILLDPPPVTGTCLDHILAAYAWGVRGCLKAQTVCPLMYSCLTPQHKRDSEKQHLIILKSSESPLENWICFGDCAVDDIVP